MSKYFTDINRVCGYRRQAITTRYLGATDTRPGRIVAKCEARRIVWSWDHALDVAENHAAAALELFESLGWHEHSELRMGGTADGFVFVQVPRGVA